MKWSATIIVVIFITIFAFNAEKHLKNRSLNPNCNSKTFQINAPEFNRGLSLLSQRLEESGHYPVEWTDLYSCIRIEYEDLAKYQAEGVFYLDRNSKDNIYTIYVD